MKTTIKDNVLHIEIPLHTPRPSSSGISGFQTFALQTFDIPPIQNQTSKIQHS
ncbi:MAG: hypothetical protein WCO57_14225 [Verrucomicrobiota bacterium]